MISRDQIIKWQEYLKGASIDGVSQYSGPIDGAANELLLELIKQLEVKTGKVFISGEEIIAPPPEKPNKEVLLFQEFLSSPEGFSLYSGPKNGFVNEQFISAIKRLEEMIAEKIDNVAVKGQIWAGKLNTTISDVKEAVSLLKTAQICMDEMNFDEEKPIHQRFVMTQEEKQLDTQDPATQQQNNLENVHLTKNFTIDDRIIELFNLLHA